MGLPLAAAPDPGYPLRPRGISHRLRRDHGPGHPRPDRATLRKVFSRVRRSGKKGKKPAREPNLTVYSPFVAPPTWKLFRWLNRRVFLRRVARDLRGIVGEDAVIVAYPPTRTTLDLISGLKPRLLYYDCSENYEGFPGVPEDTATTERALLRRANIVSCTSPALLEKIVPLRPDAFLSGPGVDYALFEGAQSPMPEEVRTVCYFGHLGRERIDFSAIKAVAGAGFQVRLVGQLGQAGRDLLNTPGVDYRGEVSHEDLPTALAGVDAFIFPYLANKLTRGISPAKTYECLATGKPVVSTPLQAMLDLGEQVYLARGAEEFIEVLKNLKALETEEKVYNRIELARRNSWAARFAALEEAIWRKL